MVFRARAQSNLAHGYRRFDEKNNKKRKYCVTENGATVPALTVKAYKEN